MVLRAAVWRSTRHANSVGLAALIASAVAALIAGFFFEYVQAGATVRFGAYGINADLAALMLTLTVSAPFVRSERRVIFLSAIMLLFALTSLACAALLFGMRLVPFSPPKLTPWAGYAVNMLWFVAYLVWWGGMMFTILRNVEPERRYTLIRTAALWLALLLVGMALPYEPAFRGRDAQYPLPGHWKFLQTAFNAGTKDNRPPRRLVNHTQVELAQPALLEAALSQLAPQIKGKTDIYAIGLAGWSDQNVFVKELNGGLESLAHVLPLDGHVVRLANSFDTADSIPVASLQNFAAAVHAVAQIMDRDEDVLLLFMTSHGSGDGIALLLAGDFYAGLPPKDVAAVLDREGIKNRIVIVSACYSGVFVKPLANARTIVLTAADEKSASFGCSDERDWTYFGDAFFNRSLLPAGDIEEAFRDAKVAIAQWELRDGIAPSNPQGYFGPALMKRLAPLYAKPGSKNAMMLPGD